MLSDRLPARALPALEALDVDLKVEPLSASSLVHLPDLAPEGVVVDACENPPHAFAILQALAGADTGVPVIVVVDREHLERHPWHEAADELVFPGAPPAELRVRLAMLHRRFAGGGEEVVRLGPVTLSVDSYQVLVDGRLLDLTYKEFELLRFLASRPGRVFTRAALLREVWGYDFYGGTRTVDVHVRRLRAKLGPGGEHLIETVRGVGYRAADL
ncbi:MAG: response regulator transcription factor [Actinobacteria bacterium]|nr:response regulator transcription factor [Actinomycetota bacterium]